MRSWCRLQQPIQGAKYRRRVPKPKQVQAKAEPQGLPGGRYRDPGHGNARRESDRAPKTRPDLLHQRAVPKGQPFKRRSLADLDKLNLESDELGPFILEGAMADWPMLKTWPVEWKEKLVALYPRAVTDFYPHNMLSTERQSPYLTRLPKAIKELTEPEETYHFGKMSPDYADGMGQIAGRYMHLQLTPQWWLDLEAQGRPPLSHIAASGA